MIRTELRPYQSEAVDAAIPYSGFAFFPEQRTGKCLISLAVVDHHKPEVLVIVCPKKALLTWEEQIEEHLDNDWGCDIYIVTYQEPVKNLKLRKQWYKWSKDWVDDGGTLMVIADEAHYIKKPGTAQSRFVRTLGKRAQWKLALTGTPTDKGFEQYWAIFDFIGKNEIFGTYSSFKERHIIYEEHERRDGRKYPVIVGYRYDNEIMEKIHEYSYRITFNEARISMGKQPVKVRRKKVRFDLERRTRHIYEELKKDLEVTLEGITVDVPLPMHLIQKLQQVCGGHLLHQERVPGEKKRKRIVLPIGTEKLDRLMGLLSGFGKEKAVICCRFTHEIESIAQEFDEFGWTYKIISGQHEWDNQFDVDFVLLQVKSGLGFDLSEANTYVLYSWDQSHITFEQSRMRIMHMENTDWVKYFFLMARDTIEDEYYEAIAKKKDFAQLVLDRYRKKKIRHRRRTARKGARRIRKASALFA